MIENSIQTEIFDRAADHSSLHLENRPLLKETSLQGYRGLISAANSRQIETCQFAGQSFALTNRFRQLHFITDYLSYPHFKLNRRNIPSRNAPRNAPSPPYYAL